MLLIGSYPCQLAMTKNVAVWLLPLLTGYGQKCRCLAPTPANLIWPKMLLSGAYPCQQATVKNFAVWLLPLCQLAADENVTVWRLPLPTGYCREI